MIGMVSNDDCDVSIHAPARGATHQFRGFYQAFACFNPRAREGRDCRSSHAKDAAHVFQSTRPRGARLDRKHQTKSVRIEFQSTRPRGARHGLP